MMTFAKGLGNGLAIGGVVARGDLMDGLHANSISDLRRQPARPRPARSPTWTTCSTTTCRPTRPGPARLIIDGLRAARREARRRRRRARQGPDDRRRAGRPGRPQPRTRRRGRAHGGDRRRRGLLIGKGGLYGNCLRLAPPLTPDRGRGRRGARRSSSTCSQSSTRGGLVVKTRSPTGSTASPGRGASDAHEPTSSTRPPARSARQVAPGVGGRRRRRRGRGRGGRPPSGGDASLTKRSQVLFAFRELLDASTRTSWPRSSPPSTARSTRDALGEVGSRPRGRRVRLRHPAPAQGRLQRGRLDRVDVYSIRQPVGRGRRHHAVQLPGHGADVDVPGGHRLRQRLHPQAQSEKDPSASMLHGRAVAAGRAARRRVQRRARRQGGGRPAPRPPGRRGRELRRLHADRPLRLRDRPTHGKRVQALGGAKNHMLVLPDADLDAAPPTPRSAPGFGSAGERCMAISVVRRRRPGRRRAGRARSPTAIADAEDRPTAPSPASDMGPLITGVHRDKVASYVDAGAADGRDARRRRPRTAAGRRRRGRLLARPDAARPRRRPT